MYLVLCLVVVLLFFLCFVLILYVLVCGIPGYKNLIHEENTRMVTVCTSTHAQLEESMYMYMEYMYCLRLFSTFVCVGLSNFVIWPNNSCCQMYDHFEEINCGRIGSTIDVILLFYVSFDSTVSIYCCQWYNSSGD